MVRPIFIQCLLNNTFNLLAQSKIYIYIYTINTKVTKTKKLKDSRNKTDSFLTFASLRGEVTGRLPTETQSMEGGAEREKEQLVFLRQHRSTKTPHTAPQRSHCVSSVLQGHRWSCSLIKLRTVASVKKLNLLFLLLCDADITSGFSWQVVPHQC